MTTSVREAALSFEARKISMSQTKDGVFIRLVIQPNDVPRDLYEAYVGARYQVAMVQISDQEEPVVPKHKAEENKAVAVAGSLCRNERFQHWLGAQSEEGAAVALRRALGIASRTELASNEQARKRFSVLQERFQTDRNMGKA